MNPNPPVPAIPAAPSRIPKACGIINLLFAGLGVVGLLGGLMMLMSPEFAARNPVFQLIKEHSDYRAFYYASNILGVVAFSALIAAGIGLLKYREWARKLTMGWAVYTILMIIPTTWFQFTYVMPATMKLAMASQPKMPGGAEGAMNVIVYASVGMGMLFALAYPITALILLTRRSAKASCQ